MSDDPSTKVVPHTRESISSVFTCPPAVRIRTVSSVDAPMPESDTDPLIPRPPTTSRVEVGAVVPMPMLPPV